MPRPASRTLADRLLNWAYDRALQSAPGISSAEELAREFLAGPGTLPEKVDHLIRWQCAKAGAVGFLTGLGGLVTLPITIPGDLAAVTYLHIRMAVAIAIMAGHDPQSERVRTFAFLALVGNSLTAVLKEAGIEAGRRVAATLAERLSAEVFVKLQQRVGSRVAAQTTTKGAARVSRLVPVAGGLVGGAINAFATRAVGKAAKRIFLGAPGTLAPNPIEIVMEPEPSLPPARPTLGADPEVLTVEAENRPEEDPGIPPRSHQ